MLVNNRIKKLAEEVKDFCPIEGLVMKLESGIQMNMELVIRVKATELKDSNPEISGKLIELANEIQALE